MPGSGVRVKRKEGVGAANGVTPSRAGRPNGTKISTLAIFVGFTRFHCYIPFTSHRGAKARSHGCAESAQDIEMGKVEEVEATREGSRSAHKQLHSPKREGAGKASQEQQDCRALGLQAGAAGKGGGEGGKQLEEGM